MSDALKLNSNVTVMSAKSLSCQDPATFTCNTSSSSQATSSSSMALTTQSLMNYSGNSSTCLNTSYASLNSSRLTTPPILKRNRRKQPTPTKRIIQAALDSSNNPQVCRSQVLDVGND